MSRLLVKHLQSKGCSRMTVLNRSLPRAEALEEEFPEVEFDVRLMPDLMACVAASDVIFAASGSEELLVRKEDLHGVPPEALLCATVCGLSSEQRIEFRYGLTAYSSSVSSVRIHNCFTAVL